MSGMRFPGHGTTTPQGVRPGPVSYFEVAGRAKIPHHPLHPFRIGKALDSATLPTFFAQYVPERHRIEHLHRLPLPIVIAFERAIRAFGNDEGGASRERRLQMTANPPRVVRRLAQRRGKPARAHPVRLGLHDSDTRGRHHDMIDVPRAHGTRCAPHHPNPQAGTTWCAHARPPPRPRSRAPTPGAASRFRVPRWPPRASAPASSAPPRPRASHHRETLSGGVPPRCGRFASRTPRSPRAVRPRSRNRRPNPSSGAGIQGARVPRQAPRGRTR